MSTKRIAGITAKLGIDASGVTTALKDIAKQGRQIASELKEVDNALKLDPDNIVLAAQKQELLAKAAENTAEKLRLLEENAEKAARSAAAYDDWKEKFDPLQAEIDETAKKLDDLRKKSARMEETKGIDPAGYEAYQRELEETKQKMEDLYRQREQLEASFEDGHISPDEYRAYQRELERTRRELNDLRGSQDQAGQSAENLGNDVEQAAHDVGNASDSMERYNRAVGDLDNAVGKVKDDLTGMAQAAGKALAAIGTAAAGGIAAATKAGMDFTKSMSNVQALSGAVGADYDALSEAAQKMGATTSKTAAQSADALGYMALAGWDVNEMLTGLEPVLRASEAGNLDLARTSDLVTDSMSALGVGTEDLAHYLDIAATAQSKSNTSLEGLLEAYIGAGGMFRELNVPLEESAAILGVLANRGIKASEAGTALNSILVNLVGANARAASAMQTLGVSAWDENGKFIGLAETLKTLDGALKSCNDEQRAMFQAQIGGKTQLDTLQALISGVSEEYDELYTSLSNADGALLRTAKTMQDNLTGDVVTLQSALEGLGISIFGNFEEPFRNAVQTASKEISGLNKSVTEGELAAVLERLAKSLGELLKKAAEFAVDEGIPDLINGLDWISRNGGTVIEIVKTLGAAWLGWKIGLMAGHLKGLVTALIEFVPAARGAAAGQQALNAAMTANVYAVAIAGAVALAEAVGSLIKRFLEADIEHRNEQNRLSDTAQAALDAAAAFHEAKTAADEQAAAMDVTAGLCERYWGQLQNLVDENGRVTGSMEDVKSAIAFLNTEADANITLIGDQIQGYSDLCKTMDDYIVRMRRDAKLSYYKEPYSEAIANIEDVNDRYEQCHKDRLQIFSDIEHLNKQLDEALASNDQILQEDIIRQIDDLNNKLTDITVEENELWKTKKDYDDVIKKFEDLSFESAQKSDSTGIGEVVKNDAKAAADTAADMGEEIGKNLRDGISEGFDASENKAAVKNKVNELDIEKLEKGLSDKDYWDRYEKEVVEPIRDILGEEDELYTEHYKKLLQGRQKVNEELERAAESERKAEEKAAEEKREAAQKAAEKELEAAQKAAEEKKKAEQERYNQSVALMKKDAEARRAAAEAEMSERQKAAAERKAQIEQAAKDEAEAYKAVIEKRDSLAESLKTTASIFETSEATDSGTGKTFKQGNITVDKIEKEVQAKEELYPLLERLMKQGTPQNIINELLKLDPIEAVEYAKKLLSSPGMLDRIKTAYKRDEAISTKLADLVVGGSDQFAALKDAGNKAGEAVAQGVSEGIKNNADAVAAALSGAVGSSDILAAFARQFNKVRLPNAGNVSLPKTFGTSSASKSNENGAQGTGNNSAGNFDPKITTLLEGIFGAVSKGNTVTADIPVTVPVYIDGNMVYKAVDKIKTNTAIRRGK